MRSSRGLAMVNDPVFWIGVFSLARGTFASNDCAPVTWQPGQFKRAVSGSATSSSQASSSSSSKSSSESIVTSSTTTNASTPLPEVTISPLYASGNISVGQVNCRYVANTEGMDINYYTCTQLANDHLITVQTFFKLNPTVKPDCSNIQANTDYCVAGFIEPLRASNGKCGPPNGNATCLGTAFQCCNSKTWTCGNTTADCAPGTCYEGSCPGDSVYTTTGQCGTQNGNKQCAGIWGDCCNADGKCGTGASFCSNGVCQSGNCTFPRSPPGPPAWGGNTTDGTCGPSNYNTCNTIWGNCCNANGYCGSDVSDCGQGCQPQYGKCTDSSPTSSPANLPSSSPTKTTAPMTSSKPLTTPTTSTPTTTSPTTTTRAPTTTAFSNLPPCGQTCFNNMQAQYSSLGCASSDSYCLCNNPNFGYGLRDCANGACGSSVAGTVIAYGGAYCSTAFATHTPTATGFDALPSCGQTCINNVKAQYSTLGCSSPDPPCLCKNPNFQYGIRDCANGACGTAVASTVISYGSSYCASATATTTAKA